MPSGRTSKKGKQEPTVKKSVFIFLNGDKYMVKKQNNNEALFGKETYTQLSINDNMADGEYVERAPGQIERHGDGTHYSRDGLIYSGKWESDKMNGEGEMKHPSGNAYKGMFVNNEFHGQGEYTWPDGSTYCGDFAKNRMEGKNVEFTDTTKRVWHGAFDGESAKGLKLKLS